MKLESIYRKEAYLCFIQILSNFLDIRLIFYIFYIRNCYRRQGNKKIAINIVKLIIIKIMIMIIMII